MGTHTCVFFNKTFNANNALSEHYQAHINEKPHICDICDTVFSAKSSFRRHVRYHGIGATFSWNICKKMFNRVYRRRLKLHQMMHKGIKNHKCNHCGKEFVQISSLKIHLNTHKAETPFQCSLCQKLSHLRVHSRHTFNHILARNLSVVLYVRQHLEEKVTWRDTQSYTMTRKVIFVKCARRRSEVRAILVVTWVFTAVWNLSLVKSVNMHSVNEGA